MILSDLEASSSAAHDNSTTLRWEARCHFCDGPSHPWQTDNTTWAKVEPLLRQQQACFECFSAAWHKLGHNNGEPFQITPREATA